MRLFGLGGNSPYMLFDKSLPNPDSSLLKGARYQIVQSTTGLPQAKIRLTFRREIPAVVNPDMSLTVLLDRSGSMREAFREGHVRQVADVILNHVAFAGVGMNLVFYDDRVSDAGHMTTISQVESAIYSNGPRGGTHVTAAMKHAVETYGKGKGMYIIVITDGEFADKVQVQKYVLETLLPQVTPDNPYAFRIHFVGAGEGVDHAFLQQIEAAAAGKGIPLVRQHRHAHLSHSHASILDEMDCALVGIGTGAKIGDPLVMDGGAGESTITRVSDPATVREWHGGSADFGFLPKQVTFGLDFPLGHGDGLPVAVQFKDRGDQNKALNFTIPLPKQLAATAGDAAAKKPLFRLPWNRSPEEEARRQQQAAEREQMRVQAEQVRQAEMIRQTRDLQSLASGGLPQQAAERLREIGDSDKAIFTSNLAPEEAGLLRKVGYEPLGIVTGSAVYHVGQAYASAYNDCEVKVLSDAYNQATFLAVNRLRQEADLIDAHGVVGVRLSLVRHEWADKTIEVQAIGTAVRGSGPKPAVPWMCDLAGQEWYALHRAGYDSAGLVWGHATWFILTTQNDEWTERSWSNVELTHYSNALSQVRHIAMGTLIGQAKQAGANGVTGVRVERRLDEVRLSGLDDNPAYEREHHNLVLSIIGTAIKVRPGSESTVRATTNVLSLRDGRLAPVGMGLADLTME